jgi:hypothetical protein
MTGRVCNGQRFWNNPRAIWVVDGSTARLRGEDLGPIGPVDPQAHFCDYWLPQRGVLAFGEAYFEPLDLSRHAVATSKDDTGRPSGRLSGAKSL